jgi:hypothetical protein
MTVAITTILDEVSARLGNITTENEYNVTVKPSSIARGKLTPFKGHDLPAINFWPSGVSNSRNYGKDIRELSLFVEIHSKTRDDPFSTIAEKLAADVVVALNRSTSAPKVSDDESIDLGGTVSDLVFNGFDYEIGEGQTPWCGALVRFSVIYAADINNMSTYTA